MMLLLLMLLTGSYIYLVVNWVQDNNDSDIADIVDRVLLDFVVADDVADVAVTVAVSVLEFQ